MESKQRELVEELYNKASMTLSKFGQLTPLYILILEDGSTLPLITADNVDIEFSEYASIAVSQAQEMNAQALLLIAEQFFINKEKDDPCLQAVIGGLLKAEDHPDKEDYLTIVYMESDGSCESLISKIYKDIRGTPFTRDFEWVDGTLTNIITPWE